MAQKNNIRSIRFSDEIAELIDRQTGDTFTQKFENLVTRCTWELPEKEEQLKEIEKKIQEKKEQLSEVRKKYNASELYLRKISERLVILEGAIDQAIDEM